MDHRKALIAMSGGVDSSVAALLMKEQGYDCVGCTMKLYQNEDAGIPKEHTCCSLDDVEDAKRIARYLKITYRYQFYRLSAFPAPSAAPSAVWEADRQAAAI